MSKDHRSPNARPDRVSTSPLASSWYAVVTKVFAGRDIRGWRKEPTAHSPADAATRIEGHSGKPGTDRPPSSRIVSPANPATTPTQVTAWGRSPVVVRST